MQNILIAGYRADLNMNDHRRPNSENFEDRFSSLPNRKNRLKLPSRILRSKKQQFQPFPN